MASTRNSQTARSNGAKSHGPKTAEGRARSSQNALKHGLTALKFVLPTEDRDDFYHLRDAYLQRFQPADPVEQRLVETLVLADYRLRRLITIETNLLSNEMTRQGPNPDPLITDMDDEDLLAWTFHHLATHTPTLQLLSRYQGQIDRAYHRTLKQLQHLQSTHPDPPQASPRLLKPQEPANPSGAGPRPVACPPKPRRRWAGSQPASHRNKTNPPPARTTPSKSASSTPLAPAPPNEPTKPQPPRDL